MPPASTSPHAIYGQWHEEVCWQRPISSWLSWRKLRNIGLLFALRRLRTPRRKGRFSLKLGVEYTLQRNIFPALFHNTTECDRTNIILEGQLLLFALHKPTFLIHPNFLVFRTGSDNHPSNLDSAGMQWKKLATKTRLVTTKGKMTSAI